MEKIALVDSELGIRRWGRYFYWTIGVLSVVALEIIVGKMVTYSLKELVLISMVVLVVLLCLMRTWTALLLLLYFAPFYGFVRWTVGITPLQAAWKESMVILLTLGWAINKFVFKREKLVSTSLNLPLFLFLWLAIIQLFRAPSILQGLFGLRILATYIPIYFIVANMPVSRKHIRSVILGLMIIGVVTASYGLWQASVGLEGLQSRGLANVGSNMATLGHLRVFSTFAGPEYLGLYMVLMIILGAVLLLSGLSKKGKITLLVAISIMFSALAFTLVRIEWLMLNIGLIFLSLLAKKSRFLIVLVICLIAMAIIFPPYVWKRVTMTFGPEDRGWQGRRKVFTEWDIPNLLNHPLGVGLGQTAGKSVYRRVTGMDRGSELIGGGTTESGYFNIALEMGIPGLILYFWLFITIIQYGLRTFHSLSDPFLKWLAGGTVAFVTSLFVCEAIGPLMQAFPAGDLYFWFLVGLLTRLRYVEKQENSVSALKLVRSAALSRDSL